MAISLNNLGNNHGSNEWNYKSSYLNIDTFSSTISLVNNWIKHMHCQIQRIYGWILPFVSLRE